MTHDLWLRTHYMWLMCLSGNSMGTSGMRCVWIMTHYMHSMRIHDLLDVTHAPVRWFYGHDWHEVRVTHDWLHATHDAFYIDLWLMMCDSCACGNSMCTKCMSCVWLTTHYIWLMCVCSNSMHTILCARVTHDSFHATYDSFYIDLWLMMCDLCACGNSMCTKIMGCVWLITHYMRLMTHSMWLNLLRMVVCVAGIRWEVLCHTLQRTATHRNTLQHTAIRCNILKHNATHCDTLQRNATHRYMLQGSDGEHCASHVLQGVAGCCSALQHAAFMSFLCIARWTSDDEYWRITRCNTLQHTATHGNTPMCVAGPLWGLSCIICVAVCCSAL